MELSGKQKKNENLTIPKEKGIKVYIYIYSRSEFNQAE